MARKKFKTPSSAVLCMTPDKPTPFQIMCQNAAIKRLRELGVDVYEDTTKFDPEYPRLLWDHDKQLTQTGADEDCHDGEYETVVHSLEEFVALFEIPEVIEVRNISEKYNAEVYHDRIEVGCLTISSEEFKELIAAAKKMGMIEE
jgi:hypothetical protein